MSDAQNVPSNGLSYKQAGVDYSKIDPLKVSAQLAAAATAGAARQLMAAGHRLRRPAHLGPLG